MNLNSTTLGHINDRTKPFRPNKKLDALIAELKQMLAPIQLAQNKNFLKPQFPVALVLGASRSGTTLISQILAANGDFAYPTNFLSRFAYAPLIGAMIQKMLFDPEFDFRGELGDLKSCIDFNSDLGKTSNALGISEFFHFWRKFFPNHEPGYLTENELNFVDIAWMQSELASIESVFRKPFISKCKMMQYNVGFFSQKMPELFFVYIKRNPRFVMQSILRSRIKYYGRNDIWWGIKPKEYEFLSTMDPIYQIAGQVYFTEKGIEKELSTVQENKKIICHYEDLCSNTKNIYYSISKKFLELGYKLDGYKLKHNFSCDNIDKLGIADIENLERAYDFFCSTDSLSKYV